MQKDPVTMIATLGITGAIGYVVWKNWPAIKRQLDGGLAAQKPVTGARTVGAGSGDAAAAQQKSWAYDASSPVSRENQARFGAAIQNLKWGGLNGGIA
jgi:hypothetical protein